MADRRNWRKAKLNVYTALKWKMNGLFKQIITSRNVIWAKHNHLISFYLDIHQLLPITEEQDAEKHQINAYKEQKNIFGE